ncbi:ORF3 [torque teno Delphinidae virus 31]
MHAKTYLRNTLFRSSPRPREQWEANRQRALARLQRSAKGKSIISHQSQKSAKERPRHVARPIFKSFPGGERSPAALKPPYPSEKTVSRPSRGTGRSIGFQTSAPSAQSRDPPTTRTPPRPTPPHQATTRATDDELSPEAQQVSFRLVLLPRTLPESLIPPIPLPFSLNLHQ